MLWEESVTMVTEKEHVATGEGCNGILVEYGHDRSWCCRPLVRTSDCFRGTRQPAVAVTARWDIPVRVCHWKKRVAG